MKVLSDQEANAIGIVKGYSYNNVISELLKLNPKAKIPETFGYDHNIGKYIMLSKETNNKSNISKAISLSELLDIIPKEISNDGKTLRLHIMKDSNDYWRAGYVRRPNDIMALIDMDYDVHEEIPYCIGVNSSRKLEDSLFGLFHCGLYNKVFDKSMFK